MINSVQLHNFKNHRSTNISLGRMNVLVGPNGSGKTSVLQALHLVHLSHPYNGGQSIFQDALQAKHLLTRGSEKFQIECIDEYLESTSNITISYDKDKDNSFSSPFMRHSEVIASGTSTVPIKLERSRKEDADELTTNIKHLNMSVSKIMQLSFTEDIPPRMEDDGSYIASTLAYLMTYNPEKFQNLLNLTKRIIPTINGIRVRPTRIQKSEKRTITIDDRQTSISDSREVIGHELVFDMLSGDTIPAHFVSEGTLVILGILTALVNVNGPVLILLDDIERGIHPWAQRTLMSIFKELLDERDDLQIVLTTHSPYIVDEVEASDVWVFNTNDKGYVESARLSDHPYAGRALEVLTTGEFLSAEGEDWVLDKVHTHES